MRSIVLALFLAATAVVRPCAARAVPIADRPDVHATYRAEHAGVATELGTLDGVPFRIDVPRDWGHRLVVYYHGYSLEPVRYDASAEQPWLAPILARGFAVIQSAYGQTGWALQSAIATTAQLRDYFIERHGRPKETLLVGASMGGALAALTIESDPAHYRGALVLCGAIAPSWELTQRQFRMLAAFAYYYPGILPPLDPVPASYAPTSAVTQRIARALAAHPHRFADLRAIWHVGTPQDMPGVIAFATALVQRAQEQAGSNPFGNAGYVYLGTSDDAVLNAGVRRYRADPAAVAELLRNYTPTGRLLRPMLELHDLADPLVPADSVEAYADRVQRAGHAGKFIHQYVAAEGHCVFSGGQVGRAFDELTRWVNLGERPGSGLLPSRLPRVQQ